MGEESDKEREREKKITRERERRREREREKPFSPGKMSSWVSKFSYLAPDCFSRQQRERRCDQMMIKTRDGDTTWVSTSITTSHLILTFFVSRGGKKSSLWHHHHPLDFWSGEFLFRSAPSSFFLHFSVFVRGILFFFLSIRIIFWGKRGQ